MTQDLITAMDLEHQVPLQRVQEMKIVETKQGYELHVPLRAWLSDEMTIREGENGPQVVVNLSEPTWRILRTRREKAPRLFKNLLTIFAYIEEKFPTVQNVEVKIQSRPVAKRPAKKTPAGKGSGRKPAKKAGPKKTTKAVKAPAKKATKQR